MLTKLTTLVAVALFGAFAFTTPAVATDATTKPACCCKDCGKCCEKCGECCKDGACAKQSCCGKGK